MASSAMGRCWGCCSKAASRARRSQLDAPGKLRYRIALRSPVAVDHLELVHNGQVVKRFDLAGDRRRFDGEGDIEVAHGGWLLLRAWNDGADPQLLDLYPYATTNPVWLDGLGGAPTRTRGCRRTSPPGSTA